MSTAPASAAGAGGSDASAQDSWRSKVSQEYRNTEVREISKVLASLEPGATPQSKLMLAIKFEEQIFGSSKSLEDYRKRLTKRLKKVQKSYKPTVDTTQTLEQQRTQRMAEMKRKHGDTLKFVMEHDAQAVRLCEEKSGSVRAKHLQQHLANARQWAIALGVITHPTKKASRPFTLDELDRLQTHLDSRVDNIRSHVLKYTHPDTQFMQEQLEALETEMGPEANLLLAKTTIRRFQKLGWTEFDDAKSVLLSSLEKAQAPIPPPSRLQTRTKEEEILLHLEKLRAASQALVAYMAVEHKESLPQRNVLSRCHTVAIQSIQYILDATTKDPNEHKDKSSKPQESMVTLEDAWTKIMELPLSGGETSSDAATAAASVDPIAAALPTNKTRRVIKSRVLLTSGRKLPMNLLPALKRKSAKLVQSLAGQGTHIVLNFEDAFSMNIYLKPLLVRFHATEPHHTTTSTTTTPTSSSTAGGGNIHNSHDTTTVKVWGVTAPKSQLEHVVARRLRHASAHATRVLRHCFSTLTAKAKSDFDIEIAEGGAL
eukprot:CAMPEP_0195302140 /NCGR_PEP_ID=MMETSP0707-20130614/30554_1 /TAXON_ID=33640 /ORGANISM="Asterionellopsis glacialis, Strain CCMP134" /LENGTH=541 /DNA_ID=CAMNT_0040365305 /DNA_START=76 /DNA_END=1698 /DNA_ORIENTATION=-